MRSLALSVAAWLLLVAAAGAQEAPVTVGVAAPLQDNLRLLGDQVRTGSAAAAAAHRAELVQANEDCSQEGGVAAARRLVDNGAGIVVGFLCTASLEAALPVLSEAGVPVIGPAVRTDSLTDRRERTGWLFYRLAPRAGAEQAALARILPNLWRDELFAIVDDGTIYGRELAESFRFAAEEAGLQAVFVDTYRPQLDNQVGLVGRLRRAGATHVFVGGDREDIAIMARDAAGLGYELQILGGEALRAADGAVPLQAGIMMIGIPDWRDIAAPEVVELLEEDGDMALGYVLPAYAATEIAITALREAARRDVPLSDLLDGEDFYTALGRVGFDERGDRAEDLYELFRFDGEAFVPANMPN